MENRRKAHKQMNDSQPKKGLWGWLKRINYRFQLLRWLILIVLSLFLAVSSYYTFKVKIANLSNLQASLAKTTVIYDQNGKKAGSVSSGKGT